MVNIKKITNVPFSLSPSDQKRNKRNNSKRVRQFSDSLIREVLMDISFGEEASSIQDTVESLYHVCVDYSCELDEDYGIATRVLGSFSGSELLDLGVSEFVEDRSSELGLTVYSYRVVSHGDSLAYWGARDLRSLGGKF